MKYYAVTGKDTNTDETTILGITGGTTVRPRITELTIGSYASPADAAASYVLQRTTAAGTSTAVTPAPLDTANPAAITTAGSAHSAEPTYTAGAVLLGVSINQRATFRWVAIPGSELIVPATANNGIGLLVKELNGTAFNVEATIIFAE